MYFLIDPSCNSVLSAALIEKDDSYSLHSVFPEAENNHVLAWFDGHDLPEHFTVDESGEIQALSKQQQVEQGLLLLSEEQEIVDDQVVTKPLEKQVSEGIIELRETQKIVDNQMVDMSYQEQIDKGLLTLEPPYEYLEDNEIKLWSIDQVLSKDLAKTQSDAKTLAADLSRSIEKVIATKFSAGYELKLTKDFAIWSAEGSPADDPRQQKFLAMQQEVDAIKASYADQKAQIAALLDSLPESAE